MNFEISWLTTIVPRAQTSLLGSRHRTSSFRLVLERPLCSLSQGSLRIARRKSSPSQLTGLYLSVSRLSPDFAAIIQRRHLLYGNACTDETVQLICGGSLWPLVGSVAVRRAPITVAWGKDDRSIFVL